MNLIFCGTPQFAVPTLEKLLAEGFAVELVVSQPDEPSGRGYEVKPPPVSSSQSHVSSSSFLDIISNSSGLRSITRYHSL